MPSPVTNDKAQYVNLELYENNYLGFAVKYNDLTNINGYAFRVRLVLGNKEISVYTLAANETSNSNLARLNNFLNITNILIANKDLFYLYRYDLEIISTDPSGYEYTDFIIQVKAHRY